MSCAIINRKSPYFSGGNTIESCNYAPKINHNAIADMDKPGFTPHAILML